MDQSINEVKSFAENLSSNLEKVIVGKHSVIENVIITLLGQGQSFN